MNTVGHAESSSRNTYIQSITSDLIENLITVSIEHLALPVIAGMSMDELTQEEFENMGGRGIKPKPFSPEQKLEIYKRIQEFYRGKLLEITIKFVTSALNQQLQPLSDDDLKTKSLELKEKIKVNQTPNWSKLNSLFKDHLCLYKELGEKIGFRIDLNAYHNQICPMMSRYRDSNELFMRINAEEFFG